MKINRRTTAAIGIASTACVVAGVATTAAAAPATTTHTLHLTTKQLQDVMAGHTDVAADKDMQRGETTGYDATSCRIDLQTHVASCLIAVARRNGMLFGHAHINLDTGKGTGKITGGLGGLKGATGTISAAPGATKNTTAVTVHYQV